MMHKKRVALPIRNFSKNTFEREFWALNQVVCGIDEVGRGCLAGPLVTAAVILPIGKINPALKDSKVMTHLQRVKAAEWIIKECVYGIGIVHNRIVDRHNIWQATLIAMRRAFMQVIVQSPMRPGALLIDAMPLSLADTSFHDIPIHYFPKGEQKSSSIAAASIIAKVKRDEIMGRLDRLFPGYYLSDHKGYATKKHQETLMNNEVSIIHRESFMSHVKARKGEYNERKQQQSLC